MNSSCALLWAHLGSNQGPSDYESVGRTRIPLFTGIPELHFSAKYDISAPYFRTSILAEIHSNY